MTLKQDQYEIVPTGQGPIDKSGIQTLLQQIRPVWQGRNLILRVDRLLPVDASSACQRVFNAAMHDLKEKVVIMGVDLAKEVASIYSLPPIDREDDIFNYNVSKTIDLAYRIGILTRPEWRRIHRCYEIRRDLEHEDDEYEAVLEDCFYIFKSSIDIILSRDPIELLKVTDAKDLVESSTNITPTEEFLQNYKSAPKIRQREINELLISYALDQNRPDIVRENALELMRHISPFTNNTVTIELATKLEQRLGRKEIDFITAKIGNACRAIGYFKKLKIKGFYFTLIDELRKAAGNWKEQGIVCTKLEDIGGLVFCPDELYRSLLEELIKTYIGEPSYGPWSGYRSVFYSNNAAPIIFRIIEQDAKRVGMYIDKLREQKDINRLIENTYILRRFEHLVDLAENINR